MKPTYKVGDWVEVRSKEEILRTLDENAQLAGMPFMPEMFAFCGQRFQVYKSAHKTCDTVNPVRGRRVDQAVHLQTRCDGSAHGGCQAGCMIFWKEAWLKPVRSAEVNAFVNVDKIAPLAESANNTAATCTEEAVSKAVFRGESSTSSPTYVCQATQLPAATSNLEWWEMSQYLEDYRSGNATLWQLICGATYFAFLWLSRAGIGLGRPIRWFYDSFHFLWRGFPFPRKAGAIPEGKPTPVENLNLQPGELVRVKPYPEILKTLNEFNRNRGLFFDAEEVPYCGKTYRVLRRVEKIVNERTGKMQEMKTPCVILDTVICQSRYSECRLLCPRSIYAYWREIWLERITP